LGRPGGGTVLVVKLSSLGDVVHAMPAVQDLRAAWPEARIDWVVERGFAPLVRRCEGVGRVIACELRRWRKAPLSAATRAEWRAFREELRAERYDAVIDLQGLTKSALVARMALLAPAGSRYALANRTAGSSYEAPTRWVADVAVTIPEQTHAVERSRLLCAQAFGYDVSGAWHFGLAPSPPGGGLGWEPARPGPIACIHGTSRDDKLWPEPHWIALGQRLVDAGHGIALPHGSDAEEARAHRLAAALGPLAEVWPRLSLDALTDRLATCAGAIGVDSGLSHIAVALALPHVQVYNFDTAWRTGPLGEGRQRSVYAQPTPTVDAVWAAWQAVTIAG
jgi:heptosyltransferase-1